ncbi:CTP synthase [Candidatus Phytoplasma palmae]|uniref:CTP synthase n=1 Tax=Candidatus Phytoplasma palmae TaxID=85624 RepID=UPI003990992C
MNKNTKQKKFIFVTGGVVSGLGKGIIAAAIGQILKKRGLKVFMQKFDPYINLDCGTMNPNQHGEVFVTCDGAETDLDLGHYERFLDENLTKKSNVTTGQIYQTVINQERKGKFLGKTIQIIPHITNEIKNNILETMKYFDYDIAIIEIGGTVGDIESLPFLESIRQIRHDLGIQNILYIHNTLIPYLKNSNEMKTKPTQHSIKELRTLGIQPQILILRSEKPVSLEMKKKISILCDVKKNAIFENIDVNVLYKIIINLHKQKIDDFILDYFQIKQLPLFDSTQWKDLIYKIENLKKEKIIISLVGKYVDSCDAYLSVTEALKHSSYYNDVPIKINYIDSEKINSYNVEKYLKNSDGILVPGGFGDRGIEGKIETIKFARTNNIPYFGICLGMQLAVIEYARNVLNLKQANSTEFDPNTSDPVIVKKIKNKLLGGTLRLGLYECQISKNSKSYEIFKKEFIYERHRHRYEVNPEYVSVFSEDNNFIFSGINPEEKLVEIIELKKHFWFVAVQFHSEFESRPLKPHPLFRDFILYAHKYHLLKK